MALLISQEIPAKNTAAGYENTTANIYFKFYDEVINTGSYGGRYLYRQVAFKHNLGVSYSKKPSGALYTYTNYSFTEKITNKTISTQYDENIRNVNMGSSGSYYAYNGENKYVYIPIGLNGVGSYNYTVDTKVSNFTTEDGSSNFIFTGNFDLYIPSLDSTYKLLSASNFSDEENPTITFNRSGSSLSGIDTTLNATIEIDGVAVITREDISTSGGSYTFELTEEERNLLRSKVTNGISKNVVFKLETVLDDVGYNKFTQSYFDELIKTFTLTDAYPSATLEVEDTDAATIALTGDNKKFIKYCSNAAFVLNATASKGATITSLEVTNGNKKATTPEGTINDIESNTFNFVATDSRNNAVSGSLFVDMVEYVKLTCQQKVELELSGAEGTGAAGTLTINGNYYKGSFGVADNELIIQTRQTDNSGNWGEWVTLTDFVEVNYNNGGYSLSVGVSGLDYAISYTFQSRAIDKLGTVLTEEYTTRIKPVFDWSGEDFNFNVPININEDKINMHDETVLRHSITTNNVVLSASGGNIYLRPGGTDDTSNETIFYGNGDIKFGGAVDLGASFTVGGNTLNDFVIESGEASMGSNGTWYWQKWASGRAECWGCRNFGNAAITTAWGNLYRSAIFTQNLPEDLFVTVPEVISINVVNSNFGCWVAKHENLAPSAVTTGAFILVRPASATVSPSYVGFDIKGFWK